MTLIVKIVKAALDYQDALLKRLPPGKIREVKGRTGRLMVDDPSGRQNTVMYFTVMNDRLAILEEKPQEIRNEVIFFGMPERDYSGVECFIDCFKKQGAARSAWAKGWVAVTGELASYDSEEILQLVEDWIDTISIHMGFRKG